MGHVFLVPAGQARAAAAQPKAGRLGKWQAWLARAGVPEHRPPTPAKPPCRLLQGGGPAEETWAAFESPQGAGLPADRFGVVKNLGKGQELLMGGNVSYSIWPCWVGLGWSLHRKNVWLMGYLEYPKCKSSILGAIPT